MKKTNIRIKDITLVDQINAIEVIVSSYFVDGEYTPSIKLSTIATTNA